MRLYHFLPAVHALSPSDLATLKRWLRRWTTVRHREVQLERRVAVSPWLNEDVQDLAFAVHGTLNVQLSAVETPL